MASKFIILAAIVAVAHAGVLRSTYLPSPHLAIDTHLARLEPLETRYEPSEGFNPAYEFKYGVHDQFSGDSKSAHEIRNGDYVQGTYSLNDPDGTRRTVDYTSTPLTGFQATVRKEPLLEKTVLPAEPIITKTAIIEPTHEIKRFESLYEPTILTAPSTRIVEPNLLLRSAGLGALKLADTKLHLATPELAPAPALRFTEPATIAIKRNDAGLIPEVLTGFAAGTRSFRTTGPITTW
ncbi:cuticle protein-like [Condylostylus longicornis]|uniref:cuticle protein-like n=1 Tax=Condylostylus longicornis TaxID=2530218 RepID=UPI00244D9B10|nr:cuticle protein-like [Condylostylus longicornis]